METIQIGSLKDNISSLIEKIEQGKEIALTKGKEKKPLAIIKPYKEAKYGKRGIGILNGKASFKLMDDFKMTDEELLSQ